MRFWEEYNAGHCWNGLFADQTLAMRNLGLMQAFYRVMCFIRICLVLGLSVVRSVFDINSRRHKNFWIVIILRYRVIRLCLRFQHIPKRCAAGSESSRRDGAAGLYFVIDCLVFDSSGCWLLFPRFFYTLGFFWVQGKWENFVQNQIVSCLCLCVLSLELVRRGLFTPQGVLSRACQVFFFLLIYCNQKKKKKKRKARVCQILYNMQLTVFRKKKNELLIEFDSQQAEASTI